MIDFEPISDDPKLLRQVFGCYPSGVTAVCALVGDEPVGIAASSFTSVSVDPPLVSICFQATSTTWPKLRGQGRIGVSVLSEDHHETCTSLSRKSPDRFADVAWEQATGGAVFVHGASAWLDCILYAEVPAGDHTIALLQIHGMRAYPETAPLVFHRSLFRRLAAI